MQPCEQKDVINNINKTLSRVEDFQVRIVGALEKLAEQGARVEHLENNSHKWEEEHDDIFNRLRIIETQLAINVPKAKLELNDAIDTLDKKMEETIELLDKKIDVAVRFLELLTSRPAVWGVGMLAGLTLIGTLCDLAYHFETIKGIITFIRG